MKRNPVAVLVLAAVWPAVAAAQPAFVPLGFLDASASPAASWAKGISAGGEYIVGYSFVSDGVSSRMHAFRWSESGGMIDLGLSPTTGLDSATASRVNNDGTVIVGTAGSYIGPYIYFQPKSGLYWTIENGTPIGHDLVETLEISDVSADGSVLVGVTRIPEGGWEDQAFIYTAADGLQKLGHLPGGGLSWAHAVSADGSVVVGEGDEGVYGHVLGLTWTAETGLIEMPDWLGGAPGGAFGISPDGSIIVGTMAYLSFAWSEATGYVDLGDEITPRDLSANGSVIVGTAWIGGDVAAGIWTATDGLRAVADVLTEAGVDLEGWKLQAATGVSDDGTRIVGGGTNPAGKYEAWLAILPATGCYPDFDGSGALNVFDFLAYVNAFNAGDPAADCDGSGSLDLFDFFCFTDQFNNGC